MGFIECLSHESLASLHRPSGTQDGAHASHTVLFTTNVDMPHQVVDSGLDETSCFFVDEDGEEVTHGHYYEELGLKPFTSSYSFDSSFYSSSTWWYTSAYPFSESKTYNSTSSPTPSAYSTSSSSSSPTAHMPSSSSYSPTYTSSSPSYSPTSSPSSSPLSSGDSSSSSYTAGVEIFTGGDFSFYPERRKVSDRVYVHLYGRALLLKEKPPGVRLHQN